MNDTMDGIIVNRCNQSDEFRTVLPAKMCVRVLLILMLAAAAVLVVGAGVGAAEKTWYVDDGGTGANFTSIQDAVGNASEGDTIYVYTGTYNECLIVYKSLILQGENRETTIIDANGGSRGIEITADDCVISGFMIRNCRDTGIKPSSSSNGSIITNNIIHSIIGSSDTDGIEVTLSSHNVISNNEIFDCNDEGIEIDGSSHNTITNNTIYSNTGVGIDVRGSLHNYVANNTIYSNGCGISLDRSWDVDPVVWGSSHSTITFNDIYLNGGDGIGLKNSSNNNITNNNISLNGDDGIGINCHSSNNSVTNNNVFSNNDNGIDMENAYNNNITKNVIHLNNADGIDLEGTSSYNTIMNNNIFDDGSDGIDMNDCSSHNSIITNNVFNNNDNGINAEDSANNNMILGNTISSNGHVGIWMRSPDNNQIYHNNFMDNTYQADDGGDNSWDMGPTVGGNYWSDHACTGNPSDGSQPYTIGGGAGAVDYYPFESMNGWSTISQIGDLDGDNHITPADAAIALRLAATGTHDDAADVSGDGHVTSLDALMILQAAAENIEL